jgi:DNA-binding response OmpR family regulator
MWRVLIVDDDPKYRRILRVHFERAGHQVFEAGEGECAIRLAESERPQVILLDFDLPDARGSSVCRRLKAHSATSSIPVVMVTAHGEEETRVESFEAGADDYVLKPFRFRDLLLRIRTLGGGGPSRVTGAFSTAREPSISTPTESAWDRS